MHFLEQNLGEGGRSVFVSIVGTDGILLMPTHSNIPWVKCCSMNIFVQYLRANSDNVKETLYFL